MIEVLIPLAVVAMGAVLGALVLLRIGSGREDRCATLRDGPPTKAAAAARRMTGLYVQTSRVTAERETQTGR